MKNGRQLLAEVVREVLREDVSIKTADGKFYDGNRANVERALVRFGASYPERQAIMSGQIPISAQALGALLRAKAVKGPPPKERAPRPYDWDKEERKRIRARTAAENKFQAAIKKFKRNFTNFTEESPDIQPEDAAYDLADNFFWEYPEWQEWANAMRNGYDGSRMTKMLMRDIVADHVFDAMTQKRRAEEKAARTRV